MKTLVVTGGTGSLGRRLVRELTDEWNVVVFSRDEYKQFEMSDAFPDVKYVLGDVRDPVRVMEALEGAHAVVHAAALKQAPPGEWQPDEYIKTNIDGTRNVVRAAIELQIPALVSISTCKAVAPLNLYGATKLCADKIVVSAGYKARGKRRWCVVRFGNFWGSRGSVLPFFLSRRGPLPVTHPDMTRFSIMGDEAVAMIKHALRHAYGGEIFIPRSPTYRVGDLADALSRPVEIIGMRPGEKMHEEMLLPSDASFTLRLENCFVRVPDRPEEYLDAHGGRPVEPNFTLVSSSEADRLSIERLRAMIETYKENAARFGDGF
ncbi:MAG: polysaccharide biosynthesis protein [Bacteroidia bacterium]|nr:polysaccharide biosynthesis protein [Bacteroidia bacterium]